MKNKTKMIKIDIWIAILSIVWYCSGLMLYSLSKYKEAPYPIMEMLGCALLGVLLIPHTFLSYRYQSYNVKVIPFIGLGYTTYGYKYLKLANYTVGIISFTYNTEDKNKEIAMYMEDYDKELNSLEKEEKSMEKPYAEKAIKENNEDYTEDNIINSTIDPEGKNFKDYPVNLSNIQLPNHVQKSNKRIRKRSV